MLCFAQGNAERSPVFPDVVFLLRDRLSDIRTNAIDMDVQLILSPAWLGIHRKSDEGSRQPTVSSALDEPPRFPCFSEVVGGIGLQNQRILDAGNLARRKKQILRCASDVFENGKAVRAIRTEIPQCAR